MLKQQASSTTSKIPKPIYWGHTSRDAVTTALERRKHVALHTHFVCLFNEFARFGRYPRFGGGISVNNLSRWLRQAKIIPYFTFGPEMEILFRIQAGKKKRLDLPETLAFMKLLADKSHLPLEAYIIEMIGCGPPLTNFDWVRPPSERINSLTTPVSVSHRVDHAIKHALQDRKSDNERRKQMAWPEKLSDLYKVRVDDGAIVTRKANPDKERIRKCLDIYNSVQRYAEPNRNAFVQKTVERAKKFMTDMHHRAERCGGQYSAALTQPDCASCSSVRTATVCGKMSGTTTMSGGASAAALLHESYSMPVRGTSAFRYDVNVNGGCDNDDDYEPVFAQPTTSVSLRKLLHHKTRRNQQQENGGDAEKRVVISPRNK